MHRDTRLSGAEADEVLGASGSGVQGGEPSASTRGPRVDSRAPHTPLTVNSTLLEVSLRKFYQENSPDKLYKVPQIMGKFVSSGASDRLLQRLNAGRVGSP